MKRTTKAQMQLALVEIVELAKLERDIFSGIDARQYNQWDRTVKLACEALGDPSYADLHNIKAKKGI